VLVPANPTDEFWTQFVSQSPEQVAGLLAKEASLLQVCALPAAQLKQADLKQWASERLSDLQRYAASKLGDQRWEAVKRFFEDPRVRWGLAGAAGGGALGLATSFAQPKERRRPFRSALLGALTGAGLGAAGGHFFGGGLQSNGVDEQGRQAAPAELVGGWFLYTDPKTGKRQPVRIEERIPVEVAQQIRDAANSGKAGRFWLSREQAEGLTHEQIAAKLQEQSSGVGPWIADKLDAWGPYAGAGLAAWPVLEFGEAHLRRSGTLSPEDLRAMRSKLQELRGQFDALKAEEAGALGKLQEAKSKLRGDFEQFARQVRNLADLEGRLSQAVNALNTAQASRTKKSAPPGTLSNVDQLKNLVSDLRRQLSAAEQEIAKSPFGGAAEELKRRLSTSGQIDIDDIMRSVENRQAVSPNDPFGELRRRYNEVLDAYNIELDKLNTPEKQRLREFFTPRNQGSPNWLSAKLKPLREFFTGPAVNTPADELARHLEKIEKFQAGGETARGVDYASDIWRKLRAKIPNRYGAGAAATLVDVPVRTALGAASYAAHHPWAKAVDIPFSLFGAMGAGKRSDAAHELADRYFGQGYRSNRAFNSADPTVRFGKLRAGTGAALASWPLISPWLYEQFFGNPFK